MAYDALNQQTDTSKQVNVLVVQVMNLLQNINFSIVGYTQGICKGGK